MFIRTLTLCAGLLVAACSGNANNFGGPPDGGPDDDASADASVDQAPQLGAIGEPCSGPTDCVAEALCIGTTQSTFRCMQICDTAYDLCETGEVCLPVMTQDAAICYDGGSAATTENCQNNLDCASGLLCFGATGEFFCRPACASPTDCGSGETCQRLASGAGLCRDTVGAACVTSLECADGLTCTDESGELVGRFAGGYCTAPCGRDSDCPADSLCRLVVGATQSVCLAGCEHRSDCRFNSTYDCLDASSCAGSSDPGACQNMFGADSLCVPGPL